MKSKKRLCIALAVIAVCLLGALAVVGCGTSFALTWSVDEHATVTVVGHKSAPSKVSSGAEIKFTVTPAQNYEVDVVAINGSKVDADSNGQYTFKVGLDTKIEVKTKLTLSSLTVTNPTKLTYNAGEELDLTGMTVTANFADGSTKTLAATDYTVTPTVAQVGMTSFKVKYDGKEKDVALDGAVRVKVTLDPNGGTIAEEVVNALKANTELADVSVDATTGVITFYYTTLTDKITLPGKNNVTKGENPEDYTFNRWMEGEATFSTIDVENETSLNLKAFFTINAVDFNKVELKMEDNKPNLIINATFKAVDKGQLFLYEGNDKVALLDEKVYTGSRGEAFDLKFDLTKLSSYQDGAYAAKWMDIRIVGIDKDGIVIPDEATEEEISAIYRSYSNEIILDLENPVGTPGETLQTADFSYRFYPYISGGSITLKVAFIPHNYDYSVEMKDVEGKPVLVVNGNVKDAATYNGSTVTIGAHDVSATGTVADGKFTVNFPLSEIKTFESWNDFTLTFKKGEEDLADINPEGIGDIPGKLALCAGSTAISEYTGGEGFSSPHVYAKTFLSANGCKYYLGTNWNTLALQVIDVAHRFLNTNATLKLENDKPYFVIQGEYGSAYTTKDAAKTALETQLKGMTIDLSEMGGGWRANQYIVKAEDATEGTLTNCFVKIGDNNTYEMYFDISAFDADLADGADPFLKKGLELFMHYNGGNFGLSTFDKKTSIIYKDVKIYLDATHSGNDWANGLVTLQFDDKNAINLTVEGKSGDIAVKDGKAVYSISGTFTTDVTDEAAIRTAIGKTYMNLQKNPNAMQDGGSDWAEVVLDPQEVVIDMTAKTFTISYDVTAMAPYAYTAHFGEGKKDLKPGVAMEKTITVGTKTYKIEVVPDNTDGKKFWGCVGLTITDTAA